MSEIKERLSITINQSKGPRIENSRDGTGRKILDKMMIFKMIVLKINDFPRVCKYSPSYPILTDI